MGRPGEDQGEQNRRRAVVDQALRFDQQAQPAGDAVLAQQGDHCDRVGGGDQRSERQRRLDPPAEAVDEPARHDRGAKEDADGREGDDRREVAPELGPRDVQRRFEQQRRQDDVEDQVVRQREAGVDAK